MFIFCTNAGKLAGAISLLLLSMQCYCQINLVPNSSFEQYTHCPTGTSLNNARNAKPDIWYKPDGRGARYLNGCATDSFNGVPVNASAGGYSYQNPRTGAAYIAMFFLNAPGTNARNYFQVKLLDSLVPSKCYYSEYYVSLANKVRVGSNNQSLLFTTAPVYVDTIAGKMILPATPQINASGGQIITDTLNWVKVSGVFNATGGEQYLTVGNFAYDSATSYEVFQPTGYYGAAYYVDDVSVYALDSFPLPADAGPDVTIVPGDSAYIGSYTSGLTGVSWYNSSGAVVATGIPGLKVSPPTSTFYVIEQTVCGNYSRDTVYVTVSTTVPLSFTDYRVNVVGGQVRHVFTTANEVDVSHYNIQRSSDGNWFNSITKVDARNTSASRYIYTENEPAPELNYYRIEAVNKDGSREYSKIVKVAVNSIARSIVVYPNPAKDVFFIEAHEAMQMQLIDNMGKVVRRQNTPAGKTTINISDLPAGLYILRATTAAGEVMVKKVVKE